MELLSINTTLNEVSARMERYQGLLRLIFNMHCEVIDF